MAERRELKGATSRFSQLASSCNVSLLGIAGVRIWLGCIPYDQRVLGDGGWGLLLSTLFRGLFPLLVVLILRGRMPSASVLRALNGACTVVLIVLGELLWMGVCGDASLVVLIAASMAAGWLYVEWGEVYARLTLQKATLYTCLSLAAAAIVVIALSFAPSFVTGLALLAFPLWGCFAFAQSLARARRRPDERTARTPLFSLRGDAKWIVSLAIYSIVWGIMQALPFGGVAEPTSVYHVVYRVAGAAIVFVPIAQLYLLKSDFNLLSIWYVITAATTVSFLMVLVSNGELSSIALTLFAVANYLILAYWWIRIIDFTQRSNRPAYVMFAFGWAVMLVFLALGEFIAKWISHLDNALVMLVSLGVFMVVVHLTTLLRSGKTMSRSADEPQVITGLDEPSADLQQVIERSIELASVDYHFTKREKEIIVLLSQGRTLQFTADQLGISLNTVRGHMKRLYAKADVHSKEELLDLLEAYRETTQA